MHLLLLLLHYFLTVIFKSNLLIIHKLISPELFIVHYLIIVPKKRSPLSNNSYCVKTDIIILPWPLLSFVLSESNTSSTLVVALDIHVYHSTMLPENNLFSRDIGVIQDILIELISKGKYSFKNWDFSLPIYLWQNFYQINKDRERIYALTIWILEYYITLSLVVLSPKLLVYNEMSMYHNLWQLIEASFQFKDILKVGLYIANKISKVGRLDDIIKCF